MRSRCYLLASAALIAGTMLTARAARADGPPTPAAAAEELLNRGRGLMADPAKLAEACHTLAESLKLADRGDTRLNLAECHRRQGRTATAWLEFDYALTVGSRVGYAEAIKAATRLRDELAAKLSRIVVVVPPAMATLEGFAIEVNGAPWPEAKWGKPTAFDPGPVQVTAVAKGYKRFVGSVTLGPDKDQQTLTVALEVVPPPPPPPKPPPPLPPKPVVVARHAPIWPWIVGAAGVALGGTAIGFEIDSQSARSQIDNKCGAGRSTCPAGTDLPATRSRELLGYGLFVGLGAAGIVALGTAGVGLGLSARRPRAPTADLILGPTSAAVRGVF